VDESFQTMATVKGTALILIAGLAAFLTFGAADKAKVDRDKAVKGVDHISRQQPALPPLWERNEQAK
jgi:hypothetical protein